ncbi:hypothetical protein LEP1GSC169_2233 [Leptospira santarosai str. HAI1349]|nr:hypothetical protein LEP1GSC169_2233 [Leptospira santarosai str. HAI1349]
MNYKWKLGRRTHRTKDRRRTWFFFGKGIRIASFSEEINVYFREFKAFLYSVSQNRDRFYEKLYRHIF